MSRLSEQPPVFRGKRYRDNEWTYGNLQVSAGPDSNAYAIEPGLNRFCDGELVDPGTLGQWSGFTDEAGVRIFEGDRVEPYMTKGPDGGVVRYGKYWTTATLCADGRVGWFVEFMLDEEAQVLLGDPLEIIYDTVKVVGNIHEKE